jgi:glycosyltransferase involved in cell wall biosynthesis
MPTTPCPWTISLIVPALNEESVIEEVVHQIHSCASDYARNFEIILVDDGSHDATGRLMDGLAAGDPRIRVLHNETNIGLGASFQKGLAQARFDYVMLLCGDGGLPAASLPAIFQRIGEEDLVIPYMNNLKRIKTTSRYLLSRGYTKLLNFLFGFRLRYYNGLPVYPRALLQAITITSSGFGFQGEILVKLLRSGCTYVEVGVAGAEKTQRSVALRPRNIFSVAKTFAHLVHEIVRFRPIPRRVIEESRERTSSYPPDGIVERPSS